MAPTLYPRWKYHKTQAPTGRWVATVADEPTGKGWCDSPAGFASADDAPAPPATSGDDIASRGAELYTATAKDIIARIDTLTDVAQLETIAALEDENPKGVRSTVVKAVEARLAELAK